MYTLKGTEMLCLVRELNYSRRLILLLLTDASVTRTKCIWVSGGRWRVTICNLVTNNLLKQSKFSKNDIRNKNDATQYLSHELNHHN